MNAWYASQLAYLVERLKALDLMKDTLCLWMLELSRGNKHSNFNAPIVMLGSPGGAFRTGRYLRFARKDANPYKFKGRSETELFVQILHALGIQATSFGDPAYHTSAMTELR